MIVLDASVVIAYAAEHDTAHERARRVVEESDDTFAMHAVTITECLVGPARIGRAEDMLALLEAMEISRVDLDENAPLRVASLRVETGLKLPDAFVLDAAAQLGAALATFDDRLAAAAEAQQVRLVRGSATP